MPTTGTQSWKSVEQWSPRVFLVAGVLLLGYAMLKTVSAFAGITAPSAFDVAYGTLGLLVAAFGLLGLYPRLRDIASRVSLAGVCATIVSAICSAAIVLWVVGATLQMEGYPAIPEDAPAWTVAALVVVFLTLALGFFLFSVASLRTAVLSRTVGFLLLVPTVAWVGLIVGNVVAPSGDYLGVLTYTPISITLLSIGYLLRGEPSPTDRAGPASDTVA